MRSFVIAVFIAAFFMSPAEARHHSSSQALFIMITADRISPELLATPQVVQGGLSAVVGFLLGFFGRPIRNLYLAANWFRFPRHISCCRDGSCP